MIMTPENSLFQPFKLGSLTLDNRIVMAPMTRNFSPNDNVPGDNVWTIIDDGQKEVSA